MKKPVKEFEGLYEVDEEGNVYSIRTTCSRRRKVLKAYSNGCGYLKVNLYDQEGNCKKKYIHRIVAEAFLPNPLHLKEVNHIDCNKRNNSVSNLEWCDRKSNLQHSYEHGRKRTCENHGSAKLNWLAVHDIRTKMLSQKQYAEKYHISISNISAIQTNRIWKEGDANVMCKTV